MFRLPGGAVNFSGFLQRNIQRTNTGYSERDTFNNASDATPSDRRFLAFSPAEQASNSVYGEVRIPLFSKSNGHPFLRDLSVQLSVRHDSYRTTANINSVGISHDSFADAIADAGTEIQSATNQTTNYTVAAEYSPVRDIIFRGSYGTGYLQPSVNEVATNITQGNADTEDPTRGNNVQDADYTRISGGLGLNFKPETSKSYSFGVILKPSFVPGDLRLSIDYTRINKSNEITSIDLFDLLEHPTRYPGRLVRAALTPTDAALGYTAGVITSLNTTDINLFRSSVTSIDFKLDYTFGAGKFGVFHPYVFATFEPHYHQQILIDTPDVDNSGYANGPLKWRGNGGVDWTLGSFSVQYNAQYYGPYLIYNSSEDPGDIDFDVQLQGSRKIRSQIYHDLYISYSPKASSGLLHGLRLSAGVQNLFNTSPPTVASIAYSQSGYSTYGDARLRRFTLTLKKAIGN